MEKRMWIRRILGILLIVGGFLFGASRGPAGVCPGDRIFSALGLPVWSQGTTGTHYPGLAGLAAAMAGIAVVNTHSRGKGKDPGVDHSGRDPCAGYGPGGPGIEDRERPWPVTSGGQEAWPDSGTERAASERRAAERRTKEGVRHGSQRCELYIFRQDPGDRGKYRGRAVSVGPGVGGDAAGYLRRGRVSGTGKARPGREDPAGIDPGSPAGTPGGSIPSGWIHTGPRS